MKHPDDDIRPVGMNTRPMITGGIRPRPTGDKSIGMHIVREETHEEEIDLVEVIRKLWKNRKLIILITLVFMIVGLIYALLSTPIYRASLTMYPATGEKKAGGLASMAASFGVSIGSGGVETYNVEDVIKSKKIGREVILQQWQTGRSVEKQNLLDFWKIETGSPEMDMYIALKRWEGMITISKNKQSGLMTLGVETSSPHLSAHIANYMGHAVTRYIQEHEGIVAEKNIAHIDLRLQDLKKELKQAERGLRKYRESNRDISSPQAQLEIGRLTRELEIKQGVYLTLNQQRELALIDRVKKSPVINILDQAEVPLMKTKPRRSFICIAFTLLGGVIGVGVVFLLTFLRENFGDFRLARIVR